jgi:hypothetical protein
MRCDGVGHPELELQSCDTCVSLEDEDAAVLLIRVAEYLAPDALQTFYDAVIKAAGGLK